jgi:hypothetical protein
LLLDETDGGSDHATHTMQGQIVDLLLLWLSNADAYYHTKSASGRSFVNVVERLMSILNILLNCVALARAKMSELAEKWLKCCQNL